MKKFFLVLIGGTVLLVGISLLGVARAGPADHRRRTCNIGHGISMGARGDAPGQRCGGSYALQIWHQGLAETVSSATE